MNPCPHSGRPQGCYHIRERSQLFGGYSPRDDSVDALCGQRVNYQSACGNPDNACCEECLRVLRSGLN